MVNSLTIACVGSLCKNGAGVEFPTDRSYSAVQPRLQAGRSRSRSQRPGRPGTPRYRRSPRPPRTDPGDPPEDGLVPVAVFHDLEAERRGQVTRYRSSGSSRSAREPEPAPPMLRMLPALPMLRIEPALPMDKIEPALPMLKTLAKLMMLPTLPKLMMLNQLLALGRPARLLVLARDSARFRPERADLCMVASSVLAASSLALPRRGSLAAPPTSLLQRRMPEDPARRSRDRHPPCHYQRNPGVGAA